MLFSPSGTLASVSSWNKWTLLLLGIFLTDPPFFKFLTLFQFSLPWWLEPGRTMKPVSLEPHFMSHQIHAPEILWNSVETKKGGKYPFHLSSWNVHSNLALTLQKSYQYTQLLLCFPQRSCYIHRTSCNFHMTCVSTLPLPLFTVSEKILTLWAVAAMWNGALNQRRQMMPCSPLSFLWHVFIPISQTPRRPRTVVCTGSRFLSFSLSPSPFSKAILRRERDSYRAKIRTDNDTAVFNYQKMWDCYLHRGW